MHTRVHSHVCMHASVHKHALQLGCVCFKMMAAI